MTDNAKSKIEPITYRIEDVVQLIRIGRSTIYAMIKRGEVRSIKIGGRTLIPSTEIQRLLKNGEGAPHAA